MLISSYEAKEMGAKFAQFKKNLLGNLYSEPGLTYFEPLIYKGEFIEIVDDDNLKFYRVTEWNV